VSTRLSPAAESCQESCQDYASRLQSVLATSRWDAVAELAAELRACWSEGRRVFLCGNGGSAGNAVHLANDFLYGISRQFGSGVRVCALSANSSILTCLANDCGYDAVFSMQLAVQGSAGDVLIALSGSGNSPNIINAIEQAKTMGIKTFAILGYDGGKARSLADVAIHFDVHDMQISEDLQLIVGHMAMQWLSRHPPAKPVSP
jgi:D-sedoheptulose 7-phosphate isomerase